MECGLRKKERRKEGEKERRKEVKKETLLKANQPQIKELYDIPPAPGNRALAEEWNAASKIYLINIQKICQRL